MLRWKGVHIAALKPLTQTCQIPRGICFFHWLGEGAPRSPESQPFQGSCMCESLLPSQGMAKFSSWNEVVMWILLQTDNKKKISGFLDIQWSSTTNGRAYRRHYECSIQTKFENY